MNQHVANILVVDDEPDLRELLQDALGGQGLNILTADSGKAALEMASHEPLDFLVTDLCLGDCTGLDIIDTLRARSIEVPTVVMTGHGDGKTLSEASQRRPVELMTKPLNIEHLRQTISDELARRQTAQRLQQRVSRLRSLARTLNLERKSIHKHLDRTCSEMSKAYQNVSDQLDQQNLVLSYQNELIAAKNDDDVFRSLFRLFVRTSGSVYGAAMVCDGEATLRIAGRFGVPYPDGISFCEKLTGPIVEKILSRPQCLRLDLTEETQQFDESIRRRLVGVTVLAIPLALNERELIGIVVLYRKGEQPFTEPDCALAELIALPTAMAIRRND